MAIDFNKQLVFDPKIEIVGEEVPLAAMEKTGAVLQDRYDKSYEQYSLADEALKQMEASANPVDREKAKELRGLYNQEMQGILQKGDFHNMRHQVSALARNAAANYKTIAERNQLIQQNIDAIRKDPRYRLDPEGAVQHYLRDLKSISVNPETRTVSDFNVGTYGEAADFETADKLLQIAPTLRAKLLKGKGSYFGTRTLPTGEKVNTIETQGGGYRILDNKEIENELKSYIVTDPAFQAYITRDVKRMGLDPNSEEGKAAYNQLVQERTADTSKALGKMYEIDENMNQNTFSVIGGSADDSGKGKGKTDMPRFTQRLSNIFNYNSGENNIILDPKDNKRLTVMENAKKSKLVELGLKVTGNDDIWDRLQNYKELPAENTTEYSRLKNHLITLGDIKKEASKEEVNKAIVNFWNNKINNAQSSIAVAQPGDEDANKYVAEINKSYFGTPTPDANTTGSSILNGQLAQAMFTNEKGKPMSAKEVFEETKNRNVRVNGWVNQIESPFEYGSHYMVAVDPASGEQKHYLIEPDLNVKNSGAYFANRILNSRTQANLVTKWQDGNGINYESTPVKGGQAYLIYINEDDKYPIKLEKDDLEILAQLPAGQANQLIQQLYLSKQPK